MVLTLAYLAALHVVVRRSIPAGIDPARTMDLAIYAMAAAFVGGKLSVFLIDLQYFFENRPIGIGSNRGTSPTAQRLCGIKHFSNSAASSSASRGQMESTLAASRT